VASSYERDGKLSGSIKLGNVLISYPVFKKDNVALGGPMSEVV
jgi:hypothetical protein